MKTKPGLVLVLLLGLNTLACLVVYGLSQPQLLEVTFFDIGQGDAIFIKTPQKHQVLVDGGPSSLILERLGQEMPFWDRTLDLIVLSHPEHDHIAGLLEVLKRYKVENILWTGVLKDTAEYREWKRLIEEEGSKIIIAKAGQKVKANKVLLDVLHPFESLAGEEIKYTNNTSIVFRLVFHENSFLFTGDAYKSVERDLLSRAKEKLKSDVLKAGHHGSKTSTAEEFVVGVSPEMAVISAGKDNKYGHPSPATLETLQNYGIKVFRTDLKGNIKIISNGTTYEVSTF